jgi:Putative transposase
MFPHRIRYLLAWDHALCRSVVAVSLRAVLGFLRPRGCQRGVIDGRGGAVAIVQRFGAALNVNIHVHALVLDGVFAPNGFGGMTWHRAAPLTGRTARAWWRSSSGACGASWRGAG